MENEIGAVAGDFEQLARQTDDLLRLAGTVVGCVENQNVLSILPIVQTMGAAARSYIQDRLESTTGILETVTAEAKLLGQLTHLTRGQRSIARETQMLSLMTNIEVAHLGQLGAGFQYLAHELNDFSQTVTTNTRELAEHTEERKSAIETTRRELAMGIPRMRQELTRIEVDLGKALAVVDSSLTQLSRTPAQLGACVEEIAGQIAGVVAAVQAHDITRQQVEHVQEALPLIAAKMNAVEAGEATHELPRIAAGLSIQIYQLRSIAETVGNWISQIRMCVDGILRISSSEVVEIGPVVLAQEREMSAQLTRIEELERECQADNEKVQNTLTGLSHLMQLVGEHLERSKAVRDRLQLLMFNSIVEASRLGTQADAILEISQSIKRISAEWSGITDKSERAMEEMMHLVETAQEGLGAFSETSNHKLREAQDETRSALENLRATATFAAGQALEIEDATARLQEKIALVGVTGNHLDACLEQIGVVQGALEDSSRQWKAEYAEAPHVCGRSEAEELYAATYTTEMERAVLRAALDQAPLPSMQQNLAGNDVELF
jgi:methyl-accepting chemotaxis protein